MDSLKQTGRTTKMMEAAIANAATGRLTFVVAANYCQRSDLLTRFAGRLPQELSANLRITTLNHLESAELEEGRARIIGYEADYFFDHFALEHLKHTWELKKQQLLVDIGGCQKRLAQLERARVLIKNLH